MKPSKPVAVFLGPSLRRQEARSLLDADYYPPARKGDVYGIMASGVKRIVLIDGVFHNTPTIWQRELLEAMEEGIRVMGAASMGALRAAELHCYGMIGCGTVFEWYRDGIIDGDDEVALRHASEEFDFRAFSEPLVNIRYTLRKAVEDDCLDTGQCEELIEYARQLYYPHRSYRHLLECPVVKGWPRASLARLEAYLLKKSVDLKKLDAIAALRQCESVAAGGRPKARVKPCHDGRADWRKPQRLLLGGFTGARSVTGEEILKKASQNRSLVKNMRRALSQRRFILEWAMCHKVSCPKKFRNSFLKRWKKEHDICDPAAWLRGNGLTPRSYAALMAERALIEWITKQGPAYFGLKRTLILQWAFENGVESLGRGSRKVDLEEWIVREGPRYFGLDWSFDTAFLQELQLSGKAGQYAAQLSAPHVSGRLGVPPADQSCIPKACTETFLPRVKYAV